MVGRYRILGPLATGGMAEVLLAHLSGPSGFERPVVVKRILPHVAAKAEFRNMFLDEARVAAQIQHPNVVAHLELGEEDQALFLVMEYLAGESLAALRRRAHARGTAVPSEVAAYVVAEACAGLHAAHELVDAEGRSQRVVHRDVSPQNLFVTYDGAVKVIDFGIAQAADRLTETESGVLKGKFEYMSPEQARAEQIDRRSDVFSLGVVLHELLVGRRLFKRRTAAGSLRAVLEESAPDPRELEPSCPASLAAVCAKALARDPSQRYATALEMRRDLRASLASDALPEETTRRLMEALFADRIEQKREMLRQMRAGAPVHIPDAEIDVDVELPALEPAAEGRRPRAHARAALLSVAALASSLAVPALWWSLGSSESAQATAPAAPAPPAAPAMVSVHVESEPPAQLVLSGSVRGVTPLSLRLPRSDTTLDATLATEGYEPYAFVIDPSGDQRLRLVLSPRAIGPARPEPETRSASPPAGRSGSAPARGAARRATSSGRPPADERTDRRGWDDLHF